MENLKNKLSLKILALISAGIFIIAFAVFLVIWVYTPDIFIKLHLPVLLDSPIVSYYGEVVARISTYLIGLVKNVEIISIVRNSDMVIIDLIPADTGISQVIKTTIEIPTSNYAFNVPLSLAIMAAFYPFIKSKWIYLEAIAILFFVHLLFVFSLEGEKLTKILTIHGYEDPNTIVQIFWEFLWGFVDNMVLRFEPFLIGAYLFFMRNRERKKPGVIDQQAEAPKQHPVYRQKKSKKKRR